MGTRQRALFPQRVMLPEGPVPGRGGTSTGTCLTPASGSGRTCGTRSPPGHGGASTGTCLSPTCCRGCSQGKASPPRPGPVSTPLTTRPCQASAWERRALPGPACRGCPQSRLQSWLRMAPALRCLAPATGRTVAPRPCRLLWLHPVLWETASPRSQVIGTPKLFCHRWRLWVRGGGRKARSALSRDSGSAAPQRATGPDTPSRLIGASQAPEGMGTARTSLHVGLPGPRSGDSQRVVQGW